MWTYLMLFVISLWPHTPAHADMGAPPRKQLHRLREMSAITADILSTDATPIESLKLENIVAYESGWERKARGPAGERGAFQIMPFKESTKIQLEEWQARGAKEALRRLRVQGIEGYCGCSQWHPCPDMVAHRTEPARVWFASHPLPSPPATQLAGNP
jgi:hypothetical protein